MKQTKAEKKLRRRINTMTAKLKQQQLIEDMRVPLRFNASKAQHQRAYRLATARARGEA